MDSLERYRLKCFLRFSELNSELGKGPRKLALQKLRKVRSWPSCDHYGDASGDGTGDRPRSDFGKSDKEISVDVPPSGGSEKTSPNSDTNVVVSSAPPKEVSGASTGLEPQTTRRWKGKGRSTGESSTPFSAASDRQLPSLAGMRRSEKRALREMEYTSRRLREFRQLSDDHQERYLNVDRANEARSRDAQSKRDRFRNTVRRLEDRHSLIEGSETIRKIEEPTLLKPLRTLEPGTVWFRGAPPRGFIAPRDGKRVFEDTKAYLRSSSALLSLTPGYHANGCALSRPHEGPCSLLPERRRCVEYRAKRGRILSCRRWGGHLGLCDWGEPSCQECGELKGYRHADGCSARRRRGN